MLPRRNTSPAPRVCEAKAMHLKLDELIRATRGARNLLIDLEDLSEEEFKKLQDEFQRLRRRAEAGERGGDDTTTPEQRPRRRSASAKRSR
jgi:low affinity Fe/Cu permease